MLIFREDFAILIEKDIVTWHNRTVCYNSTDCRTDPAEYCNHDKNSFGFCEECSGLLRDCVGENFFCYNGEKSCNESCECKISIIYLFYGS